MSAELISDTYDIITLVQAMVQKGAAVAQWLR